MTEAVSDTNSRSLVALHTTTQIWRPSALIKLIKLIKLGRLPPRTQKPATTTIPLNKAGRERML